MAGTYPKIIRDGLWDNNPGIVQILGLCPMLAVTTSVVNAIGLGLATTAVLVMSNVAISLIRSLVPQDVRIPVFVLVIASFVTAVELTMNAYFYELYKILGIFIPLIVTNCVIIGRAEAFASKNRAGYALVDGLAMGLGFTAVLITLGGMREILGHGTLLNQANLMFGEGARALTLHVIDNYRGFLVAILPPGAFLGMGLLIALKNVIDTRSKRRAAERAKAAKVSGGAEAAA